MARRAKLAQSPPLSPLPQSRVAWDQNLGAEDYVLKIEGRRGGRALELKTCY